MNSQHSRTPTRSPSPPPPAGLSIDLNDIFYVFFRRWKMILLIGLLSIPAAIYCYFKFPPMYTSEAKVMVRYVQDRRSIAPGTTDSSIMSTDSRGDNIMNSQLMIFQSFDLALAVADKIGPDKILAVLGGGTNRYAAAGALARGTRVDNPKKSNIIIVSVSHPDPTVVQPALQTLLDSYVEKHVEIYQNKGVIEDLQRRQRDLLRTALIDTETQLINIQTNSGILSIEDSRRSLSTQISRLEDEITTTEINLAGARVLKAQLERTSGRTADTNQVDSTNAPSNAAAQASTPVVAPTNTQPVTPAADLHPSDKVDALAALDTELETLTKLEKQQLRQYTEIHPGVKRTQRLLKETQTQIEKMESENVGLRAQVQKSAADRLRPPTTAGSTGGAALASVPASTGDPLQDAISRIAVLASTRIALKAQHDKLQLSIGEIVSAEHKIAQLRRTKELQEKSFSYYQSGMDQAAADEALGPGKFTGIERVQNPSLPASSIEDRVKYVGGSAAIPWVLAFLIAFALDLLLDQSLRKPSDVERRSGVPLFISLPDRPAMVKASKANEGRKILQLAAGSEDTGDELGTEAELPAVFNAPLEAEHGLDVYFETL
ncbi:MAG: hypothetical protein FJ405_13785, partial [Verrucomicrobia bacterium]|nr:hypothetical protein [Verrucomicrobiota bacterium]